jgi:transposase-like protein
MSIMSTTSDSVRTPAGARSKRYDEQFKLDAVRLRQQTGRPRAQVARDLGISDVSLAAWEARYGAQGAGAVARSAATQAGAGPLSAVTALAEVARLQRELEWMTRQRDILKKAMAIVSQEPRSTLK